MALTKKNTVSFADIFHYAEKHFGMHWNKCNDVFFDDLFDYQGHRELYLEEIKGDLEDEAMELTKDQKTAREAVIAFMTENKVTEMLVLG